MIRNANKLETEGSFLNLIKAIYQTCKVNTILKGNRLNAFLIKAVTRQRGLFIIVLQILGSEIKHRAGDLASKPS